jgi:hypothetical protein
MKTKPVRLQKQVRKETRYVTVIAAFNPETNFTLAINVPGPACEGNGSASTPSEDGAVRGSTS